MVCHCKVIVRVSLLAVTLVFKWWSDIFGRFRFIYTFFAIPIHSRVLVILGNSGVPSAKSGGLPLSIT